MEKYSRAVSHVADGHYVVTIQKGTGTVIIGMEYPYVIGTTPDTSREGGKPLILFASKFNSASETDAAYYAAIGRAVCASADSPMFYSRPGSHRIDDGTEENEVPLLEAIADRLLKEGRV